MSCKSAINASNSESPSGKFPLATNLLIAMVSQITWATSEAQQVYIVIVYLANALNYTQSFP